MDKLILCSFSKQNALFTDEFNPFCSYTVKHGHHDTSFWLGLGLELFYPLRQGQK